MKITLHQCHLKVGNVAANMPCGDDDTLHIWPEMTLAGYMAEDLVRHDDFIAACQALPQSGDHLFGTVTYRRPRTVTPAQAGVWSKRSDSDDMIISQADACSDAPDARLRGHDDGVYNTAILVSAGTELARTHKHLLPNYGVFDDKRVFRAGPLPKPIDYKGCKLGVLICEDMWDAAPATYLKQHGADILIVINGSPYETDKRTQRIDIARARVMETGLPLVYLNRVGGQDQVVFDGASFGLNADGSVAFEMDAFAEQTLILTVTPAKAGVHLDVDSGVRRNDDSSMDRDALDYTAIVTGIRDYVRDNGFSRVLLGLSGGVDSALVAALAVDALGPENVHCVGLPTRYTARQSFDDAHALVKTLGCSFEIIPIEPALTAMDTVLGGYAHQGLTFENLQSRLRGATLMAISNATGALVLTTGNKSEYAAGYATLYGDMCGAYAPIKDVYKTRVYDLCRWRGIIPQSILDRPPTAELRDNQTDQDSLPPYDVLDGILERMVEGEQSPAQIIAAGFDADIVHKTARLLRASEYKRQQAAIGPKITRRAFGRDRRLPITNGFV